MKRSRCASILAAISCAVLAACGGGEANSDNFVSVQEFESGSAGFFLMGSGSAVRIASYGVGANADVGRAPIGGQTIAPPTKSEGEDTDGDGTMDSNTQVVVPGWADMEMRVEGQTRVLQGAFISGSSRLPIDAMIYSVCGGGTRAHLELYFTDNGNNVQISQALAHFFGVVVASDVSANGNTNNNYTYYDRNTSRVLLTSATGAAIKAWFNFDTGTAIFQLIGQVAQANQWSSITGYPTSWGNPEEGALYTSTNCSFRKTIN